MLSLIVTIAILGLIAWVITLLPIPTPFDKIIWVILVVIAVVVLLRAVGVNLPVLSL